jgi:hypothetical protein
MPKKLSKPLDNIEPGFNVRAGIEHYMPSLLNLVEGDFSWNELSKLQNRQFKKYVERLNKSGTFKNRLSLFEVVVTASKGNADNRIFANTLNILFTRLGNALDANQKKMLRGNLYDLIRYSTDFLNYVGEFMILDVLIKSGYKFIHSEFGIKKGLTTIDFKMLNKRTEMYEYFEVFNLEMNSKHLINNEVTERFLRGKFEKKLTDKDKSGLLYALNPVIWIEDTENTLKLKAFYKETHFKMERVSTPFILSRFDHGGVTYESFSSILEVYEPSLLDLPQNQ